MAVLLSGSVQFCSSIKLVNTIPTYLHIITNVVVCHFFAFLYGFKYSPIFFIAGESFRPFGKRVWVQLLYLWNHSEHSLVRAAWRVAVWVPRASVRLKGDRWECLLPWRRFRWAPLPVSLAAGLRRRQCDLQPSPATCDMTRATRILSPGPKLGLTMIFYVSLLLAWQ